MNNFLGWVVGVDLWFNNFLYFYRSPSMITFFSWVTILGNTSTIIILTIIISTLLLSTHKKWHILMFLFTIISSEAFTFLIKMLVHRQRPVNAIFAENSFSFPSGHANIAVAFYGFLVYLLLIKIKNKVHKTLLISVSFVLIFLIGFSRLYLGVHYLSDVLVGYLIGLLWLIVGIRLTNLKMFKE